MEDIVKKMDEISENKFFEWFDHAQALADKHNVEIHNIYNIRQVWDYAFSAGALAYAQHTNEKIGN